MQSKFQTYLETKTSKHNLMFALLDGVEYFDYKKKLFRLSSSEPYHVKVSNMISWVVELRYAKLLKISIKIVIPEVKLIS